MLNAYYLNKKNLKDHTGPVLTPVQKNGKDTGEVLITNYEKGQVTAQVTVDPETESIEDVLEGFYPVQEVNWDDVPKDEDGEPIIEEAPLLPPDYSVIPTLVDKKIADIVQKNTEEYPCANFIVLPPDPEETFSSSEIENRAIERARREEEESERVERMINRMQDNGLI